MTHQKIFLSFSEQAQKLQFEKHLIITDYQYVIDMLKQIGYFPLINGYKHLFRIPLTSKYKNGTTFEEITVLYNFDSDLRELFFRYLLQIERHIRSLLSYYFSEEFGESQNAYLSITNFSYNKRTRKTAYQLITVLQRAASSTDHDYINHYRITYENIPLWVLINVLTFGNLSKMYQVLPQSLQSKICKNFTGIYSYQMKQFLSVLTKFRNVCAHGERLFNYRTRDSISDLPLHKKLSIPTNGIQYQYGKNDLFAVVIAFRYLLSGKDFCVFKKRLSQLIEKTCKALLHIEHSELLQHMGFPSNWKNITRYRSD